MTPAKYAVSVLSAILASVAVSGCKAEDPVLRQAPRESLQDHILKPSDSLLELLAESRESLRRATAGSQAAGTKTTAARMMALLMEIDQRLAVMKRVRDASGLSASIADRRRLMEKAESEYAREAEARKTAERREKSYAAAYARSAGYGPDRIDYVDANGRTVRSETTDKGREKESAARYETAMNEARSAEQAYGERGERLERLARASTDSGIEAAKTFLGEQSDIINDRLRPALVEAMTALKARLARPSDSGAPSGTTVSIP